jgi:predicted membrane-bound spermidine synthase
MKKWISAQLAAFGLLFIFHILVLLRIFPADIVWGGQIRDVQANLITLESIALIVTLLFILIIAARLGYIRAGRLSGLVNLGVWLLFTFLALNTLGNLVSGVTFESLFAAPLTILLALCALRLALEK